MTGDWPRLLRLALVAPALFLLASTWAPHAVAHTRSTSTSAWWLEPGEPAEARVVVRFAWADLQRAVPGLAGLTPDRLDLRPDLAGAVGEYVVSHVGLRTASGPCGVRGPLEPSPSADRGHFALRWRVRCAESGPPTLRFDALFEVLPAHFHIARVRLGDGRTLERVLVAESTRFVLARPDARGPEASSFTDYLWLGVEHIVTGYDHLCFLLALLLTGVSVRALATIVTGFTVAHSLTLALGVLGVVRPQPAAIEALIGLSIVVVALENFSFQLDRAARRALVAGLAALVGVATLGAWAGRLAVPGGALAGIGLFSVSYLTLQQRSLRPDTLRWFVALVFGLVHGFGFAGLLAEVGLPPGRVAPALLGFNLGVEAGQLAIVIGVWPLLRRAGRSRAALLVQVGSAAVLALGLYWFLSRMLA